MVLPVVVRSVNDAAPPDDINVPLTAGRVSTVEPDTAWACKVTLPLVSPATITLDILFNSLE
jgi:hypothetical protein